MKITNFLLRLKLQNGIGYVKMLQIASQLPTSEVNPEIIKQMDLPSELIKSALTAFYNQQAEAKIVRIKKQCQIISFFDQMYPQKLREIYRPPLILFAQGNLKLLQENVITIVGSRQATDYSQLVLNKIVPQLVKSNFVIASGLAMGVDVMAHSVTLNNGGKTIAVIGNGLNHFYPERNSQIQRQIINEGLVLSEYLPDTPPRPFRFPERNRILAGIADSVIVTEAKEKSGSLITANIALQENRNIYAVPGPINSQLSTGPNKLIEAGATPITDFSSLA
ncbi:MULTISPECIES: DNA-processing protein DprA [Lactobacillus]|uniref:DNA-processing protein DprA n=1 Tax=Lactobacillus TaxID=1578 RepID=UPI0018DC3134|nr:MULTISPECIES: DNA-processing protein DprA [Lactobacillus]MBI0021986.1 DNA-protecting protein DprA [Lactobacillus sp. W8172]